VVFDARGHFHEPHTKVGVPLSTLQVRAYLNEMNSAAPDLELTDLIDLPVLYPTQGPKNRYQAILFIEKEGFIPLFDKVGLAKRYDIAIMGTKGMSATAARLLVDRLCTDIPLLVLHDFDKAGFSISGTLKRNTRRYWFRHPPNVIDLGLRLKDVKDYGFESDAVSYGKTNPIVNLEQNGATREEIVFLYSGSRYTAGHHGQRVELNAFTSDQLVAWIEDKLKQAGLKKVVPSNSVLVGAYRRAVAPNHLEMNLQALQEQAMRAGKETEIPAGLHDSILDALQDHPARSWDEVLQDFAKQAGPVGGEEYR
jgi:DNA topoisomerase VI, subunit A